ncbi:MAG: 4-hydroxy-tetrahydrodipicolinate synthase [Eggerthellaceae bacterium]
MNTAAEPRFGRMIPAMVTPFDENLELDLKQARALARRLIDGGADALVINGTTGESPTVFYPQKMKLFEAVVSEASGEIPIIANVGDNCTADTVNFAKDVQKLGVDGFLLVVPYYNKPPQEGLYQHFKTIADAVDLPCMLYNIPGRCVVNMEAETTLRLARDCENIVGIKEASGKFDQIETIINHAPDGFAVYSGDDALTYDMMKIGAAGVITTAGNVAPARMKELTTLCAEGKWEDAKRVHDALLPFMHELFVTANPIMVKAALNVAGFKVGGVRLPLVDATPEQVAHLTQVMKEVGVL